MGGVGWVRLGVRVGDGGGGVMVSICFGRGGDESKWVFCFVF